MHAAVILSALAFAASEGLAQGEAFGVLDHPVHVEWRVAYHPELSDAEFQAMRARVEAHPEHPDRSRFESEARRRAGPEVVRHEAWVDDRGVVRSNTSNTADPLWADVATNGNTTWCLSPAQLTLISTSSGGAADAPELGAMLEEAQQTIAIFLTGGRSITGALPVGEWEGGGGSWRASGDGLRLGLQETGDAVVISVEEAEASPEAVGLRWELHHPETRAPLGCLAEGAAWLEFSSDGRLVKETTIERLEDSTAEELARVRSIPAFDGEDAVRGPTTFVGIYDYRSDEASIRVRSGEGTRVVKLSDTPEGVAGRRFKIIGWATAGVLVATLVGMKARIKARGV